MLAGACRLVFNRRAPDSPVMSIVRRKGQATSRVVARDMHPRMEGFAPAVLVLGLYEVDLFPVGDRKVLRKVILSGLLLGLSSSCFAAGSQQSCNWPWPFSVLFCSNPTSPSPWSGPQPPPHVAPEMDPKFAVGALTLFVGGLVVLRSRSRSS
jgi:hypothetical protein